MWRKSDEVTVDEVTVKVDRLSYDGRGVGRLDGFVVFADDTAPGDVVRARLVTVKRTFAEAQMLHVEEASPSRVQPRCPHFGLCGGCLWQHLAYPAQAQAKQAIVAGSLERLGGLRDLPMRPIIAMDEPWYYRNKMEFSFHPPGRLGLHRRGRWDEIVDLDVCFLQSPRTAEIIREVRGFVRAHGIPCYDPRTHAGFLRHLVIREGKSTGEVMVALVTAPGEFRESRALTEMLVRRHPELTSILWANSLQGDAGEVRGFHVLHGRPHIFERLRDLTFRLGLLTFFQTNTVQAERMLDVVREFAEVDGATRVMDLYCGVGTFALALARSARQVIGIEAVPAAVEAARENAALNQIANAQFYAADARQVGELIPPGENPDLVVLDPPRAGAGARVMQQIGRLGPPRIVYVSCNPTTLAVDLRELIRFQYGITAVQPVDLFPHSYHVECIVRLDHAAA